MTKHDLAQKAQAELIRKQRELVRTRGRGWSRGFPNKLDAPKRSLFSGRPESSQNLLAEGVQVDVIVRPCIGDYIRPRTVCDACDRLPDLGVVDRDSDRNSGSDRGCQGLPGTDRSAAGRMADETDIVRKPLVNKMKKPLNPRQFRGF
jgi:hypothetical protein